ncbi:MAG TPA: SurA N-terminal domain-containing protein [bacterium]|nr:SurA N-terminal domain-containing protein [bacterium]
MLDEIRRHAANWVVKATLGVIIFTFIAFFGWSRVANRYQDAHLYVASVGGQGIPRKKYENLMQETVERLRQDISGNLPENMEEILKGNVLDQLVTRELAARYGHELGLTVSDEEVAEFIRNNTGLFAAGNFDLKAYENNFLPDYRRRNGEDFENAVRRDLLIEKTQTVVTAAFGPWESELDRSLEEKSSSITSTSPIDLFGDWLEIQRQKTKIETYR